MDCRDCARFDEEARKCLDNKVNPHSWEIAVTVSQVLGLRSICVFNDYREKLVRSRTPATKDQRLPLNGGGRFSWKCGRDVRHVRD